MPATIELLPAIVAAVGDGGDVILDGGVRRGIDVVKALALGARAVGIGRPILYALAAGGAPGVEAAITMLAAETREAMTLCGARSVAELTPDLLA